MLDKDHATAGRGLGAVLSARVDRLAASSADERAAVVSALADASGTTVETVSRHLAGSTASPPFARLEAFAGVLGCSVGELVAAAEADGGDYSSAKGRSRAAVDYQVSTVQTEVEVKEEGGETVIEAYASVFRPDDGSATDNHGDAIVKGAFARTIRERMAAGLIKVLRWHQDLVGVPRHLEEDSKGLFTVSRLFKTRAGADAAIEAREGGLQHMSIGFDPVREELIRNDDGYVVGRIIREVKLYEYSLVPWPADEGAVVLAVKGLLDEFTPLFARLEDVACLVGKRPTAGERELVDTLTMKLAAVRGRFRTILGSADAPGSGTSREGSPPDLTASIKPKTDEKAARLIALADDMERGFRALRIARVF